MNLTPLDIRKHEFRKKFNGFDPEEVSAFLEIVSMEYENLVHENSMLNEKYAMTDSQLKKFRTIETTLQETLLTAERSREETIKTARKEAEVIIREAEVRASVLLEEGQNSLVRLRNTFNELKMHKDTYLAKLKALVTTQAELFQKYSFGEEKVFEKIESTPVEQKAPIRKTPRQQIEDDIRRDSMEREEADSEAGDGAGREA